MERTMLDTESRLRAMEAAFQRERQQRDLIEKKYARLKRRYVRLERSHSRLLTESKSNSASPAQSETPESVESTPNSRTSTFAVIDLTSPYAAANSALRSSNGSPDSVSTTGNFLSRDDICAESPSSSLGSPALSARETHDSEDQEEKEDVRESWRRSTDLLYSVPASRGRRHLDFLLPSSFTESHHALASPPRRMHQHRLQSEQSKSSHSSPQSAHSMTTHAGEPRTRTRPRLQQHHHSPERTAARAYGYELEQELEPRTHQHDRYRWASEPSPEPSTPSPVVSSPVASSPLVPTNPSPLPAAAPSSVTQTISSTVAFALAESDEEASLALARYLQQQENIAAYEEYEARLLRESAQQEDNQGLSLPNSSLLSGLVGHHRNIDPDNMTYEELLSLGEEVGDVKKERWRRMAVQVLSSLPTHRWTRGHGEDISCIVCQYNFVPSDRAMTLPCAHVFHEDCVGGWIRENNSCPLCKGEIAPM